jgi:hypothetical protein
MPRFKPIRQWKFLTSWSGKKEACWLSGLLRMVES